jgi:hypothetical protein
VVVLETIAVSLAGQEIHHLQVHLKEIMVATLRVLVAVLAVVVELLRQVEMQAHQGQHPVTVVTEPHPLFLGRLHLMLAVVAVVYIKTLGH